MAPSSISKLTISNAQRMRKDMTRGELRLWSELRKLKVLGFHVRKQVPIGMYIADFAIMKERLIIEVDGSHHQELKQIKHDKKRDAWLRSEGFRILRFNTEELDETLSGCVEEVIRELGVS
jgi:very-short-patch-repair endonuclease